MFGSNDELGFGVDDLDMSPEARRRRSEFWKLSQGVRLFNLVMAFILPLLIGVVFVWTLRSELSNRWTTFWAVASILLATALAIEVFLVNKQIRVARSSDSVFTGDERA